MDERENLPSISQFEAMALCPARWQLGQQVPEPPESADAQYGNQVHAAMETGETDDLTEEQRKTAHEMAVQEQLLVREIFGGIAPKQHREKRFWYKRNPGAALSRLQEKLFSGKLDYSAFDYSHERVSLYIDYKAMWGDVTPPAHNLQLRGGAVLMKQNFRSHRAFVAICQPAKHKIAVAAEYGPEELEQAEQEIVAIVERSLNGTDYLAIPGPEQCRYCRAKLICKVAYRESVDNLATTHDLVENAPNTLLELIQAMPDASLDLMGARWEVAQILGKAIETEIRRRKEADPDSMQNYQFVPSGYTSEIANPMKTWPRFKHLLTAQDFAAACKVSKGELEKMVHVTTGQSMADAKRTVAKLLGDLLVKKPKKPSLERKPYYEIK